ncbi:MAG: hypothetical protein Q9M50_05930 [Methylococcales bacterium]|nr:hypothetical protein [Methylococcales bacterium]
MSLTHDIAAEDYQIACDQLMEIAEDYSTSEETAEIALASAQELTLKFIDSSIDDIGELNRHYGLFIETLERIIRDLERTPLERLLIGPIKKHLQNSKKKSSTPLIENNWSYKLDLIFKWFRTRMGMR